MSLRRVLPALLAGCLVVPAAHATRFTYHGELMDGDAPAAGRYDLEVRAFASLSGTKALGEASVFPEILVQEGRFAVELDLPEDPDGMTWVQVAVRGSDSKAAFTTLGERQAISKANSTCPGAWALDGNTGMPGGSFLGIADPASVTALELRAGNQPVARFAPPVVSGFGHAPSVTLGSRGNVASGIGATVGGGGGTRFGDFPCDACGNQSPGDFATVGGGLANYSLSPYATVAGGSSNLASASYATIGGGGTNRAEASHATVSGGSGNLASGLNSSVAGGIGNRATSPGASVGGGQQNAARSLHATVPGGTGNLAGGAGSFAAGSNARVRLVGPVPATIPDGLVDADYSPGPADDGSFVWSDQSAGFMHSSGPNQFVVRAAGGVGINTAPISGDTLTLRAPAASPDALLRVAAASALNASIRVIDGTGNVTLAASTGHLLLHTQSNNRYIITNDRVGVMRTPAVNALEVEGTASKNTAGDWAANSDRRIKRDIEPIDGALETILQLRPVSFRYEDGYRRAHGITDQRYFNVIAQEFAAVFPHAVRGSGEYLEGGAKSAANEILQVDTYPAQIVAIAAIQELAMQDETQHEDMATLKAANAALQSEDAALRTELAKLLRRLERLEARQEH